MSDSTVVSRASLCILHLDDGVGWRGGQQQVAFLIREQLQAGHRPILLCPRAAPLAERVGEMGVECEAFDLSAGWWSRVVHGRAALSRLVVRHAPDVVHAHTSHTHFLLQMATGRSRPLRVVTRRLARVSRAALSRLKYGRGIDLFVAVSAAVGRALVASGASPARIAVAHSAIDPARFDSPPARALVLAGLGIPPTARVIGSLGSLVPQKAHLDLIEAFARLARYDPGLHLLILGEGVLRPDLEAAARRTGAGDRIHLPGFRSDLGDILPHLELMAFPSLFEGMPNAVLDALAAGVAVVATPAGGTGEVISDDVGGVLVPFHSPRRLAAAVAGLLANPAHRRRLAAAGRARVLERHVPAVMAARTEEAYRQALERRRYGRPEGATRGSRGHLVAVESGDEAIAGELAARASEGRDLPPAPGPVTMTVGATGRGPTWMGPLAGRDAVIKLHRHGGLVGRLLDSLPGHRAEMWMGTARVRHEMWVGETGRARGAPLPEPLGWLAVRAGLLRRLYAVTARVADAVPLDRALQASAGSAHVGLVRAAARAVARLHHAGVRHGDLNMGNLLWSEAIREVIVIDLARAHLRPRLGADDRARDLARLERSALKILGAEAVSGRERWRFLAAYQQERAWLEPLPDRRRSTQDLLGVLRRYRLLFPLHGVTG